MTRPHSLIGFSGAERLLNCSASLYYQLTKKLVKRESPAAADGSLKHDVAERLIKNFLDHKLSGTALLTRADIPESDEVYEAAEFVRKQIWEVVLESSITGKFYGLEDKFEVTNPYTPLFSYIDWWSIHLDHRAKRVLRVADYKFGAGEVEAEGNAQLMGYILCILEYLKEHGKTVDIIEGYIIQPQSKQQVKHVKFSIKEIERFKEKYFKQIHSVYVDKKSKHKTGKWCFFCPAKGVCSEYTKELVTKRHLALLQESKPTFPPIESLSQEQKSRIAENSKDLLDYIDAVVEQVKEEMKGGEVYPNLELTQKQGNIKWIDDETAIKKVLTEYPKVALVKEKLLGVREVEKQLKKYYPTEAPQIMQQITEHHTDKFILNTKEKQNDTRKK